MEMVGSVTASPAERILTILIGPLLGKSNRNVVDGICIMVVDRGCGGRAANTRIWEASRPFDWRSLSNTQRPWEPSGNWRTGEVIYQLHPNTPL